MRHAHRAIDAVMAVELPRKSALGVEEVEMLAHVQQLVTIITHLVVLTLNFIVDMAVLQVSVGRQPIQEGIAGFGIDIPVIFGSVVEIIVAVGIGIPPTLLHPKHTAEVVAVIMVKASAKGSIPPPMLVVEREHSSEKPVVHRLLAHQVALFYQFAIFLERPQAIFDEIAVYLVFLVVAVALGVVQPHIELQGIAEAVVEQQLPVLLRIVICLILVILPVALLIIILATRVIRPAIEGHLLL